MQKTKFTETALILILVSLDIETHQSLPVSTEGCPMPKELRNGKIIYEKPEDAFLDVAPLNNLLRFACEVGYKRIGPRYIICVEGKWTDDPPSCINLHCRQPPDVTNGAYKILNGNPFLPSVGSIASYSCSEGFQLAEENTTSLRCVIEKGEAIWKGTIPQCIGKKTCTDPGVSPDGRRIGSCCFVGDTIRYTCNHGFELVGEEVLMCESSGLWSSSRPACRPTTGHCSNPPHISHGKVKGDKVGDYYAVFEEAEVVCDPGYAYFGESEYIMCEENHEWEFDFGECREVFCDTPIAPENGIIPEVEDANVTSFSHGFALTYACNIGFRLIGASTRYCDRGKWREEEPKCEEIKCYDPGVPENGMRNGQDFGIGSKVTFSCFSGFSVIGSEERYCRPNGQWSGELTRCNLISNHCPNPGIPINGRKVGNSYNEGDKVEFGCYPGFSLVGSAVRECLPDGTWSGREAMCLGAYDFDNIVDIGEALKEILHEKSEEQAKELRKHNETIALFTGDWDTENGTSNFTGIQMERTLDINYPGRLILYFVFDVSGSVLEQNFRRSINFAKALVKKIGITETGARAGALTFGSKADVWFYPPHFSTTEEVLEGLDRIEYARGGTATNSALKLVAEDMIPLTKQRLHPTGMKSVVFLLTDGKSNTGGNPKEQARLLKEAGVEIYCIGITGDDQKNQLYAIASEPENVFILDNYNTMEWLIEEITNGTIDYSKCGLGLEKGGSKVRPRVLGGETASEPWPWMAALYIKQEMKCGGSIIGQKHILTAAHCVSKNRTKATIKTSEISVQLGLTDLKNFTYLQEFEVNEIVVHPLYNPIILDYDIALLVLNRLIEYNAYVRPVCLPPEDIFSNTLLYKPLQNAFAAGWGYDKVMRDREWFKAKAVRNLKELRLPLQARETCHKSLQDNGGGTDEFTQRMICAGTGDGRSDTCRGDSGGPLMQSQMNSMGYVYWTQIGITSWGIGCGMINTYGYYTNVHEVLPWIKTVLQAKE